MQWSHAYITLAVVPAPVGRPASTCATCHQRRTAQQQLSICPARGAVRPGTSVLCSTTSPHNLHLLKTVTTYSDYRVTRVISGHVARGESGDTCLVWRGHPSLTLVSSSRCVDSGQCDLDTAGHYRHTLPPSAHVCRVSSARRRNW